MAATTTPQEATTTHVAIGETVHTLMWKRRITQTAFAAELGVTQSTLSRKLRGERPWDADEVLRAARLLRVSVSVLFGEDDNPTPDGDPATEWAPSGSNRRPMGRRSERSLHLVAIEQAAA